MKYLIPTLTLALVSQSALADSLLKKYCDEPRGTISNGFTCPKSKLPLGWDFCVSKDRENRTLFFDGCTGPTGGHTELFYPSCIKHDYCYHHARATKGYEQLDCDKEFLANATASCVNAPDKSKCESWAKTMYLGLRGFGKVAFNCADYKAEYE